MNTNSFTQELLALGLAVLFISSPSSKTDYNKFVTVYWFYTTTNPPISISPNIVAVDISVAPLIGTETTVPTGCNNDGVLWCAKGFTSAEVDPVTHKPPNAKSPATYAAAKMES